MTDNAAISPDYTTWLGEVKTRIRSARLSAARSVNRELIGLYWDIGRGIVEKQQELGWGKSVVESLSRDLQLEFPSVRGFSPDNLWRMRQLYSEYSGAEFLAQAGEELKRLRVPEFMEQAVPEYRDELSSAIPEQSVPESVLRAVRELAMLTPWGHHLEIMKKVTEPAARLYYLEGRLIERLKDFMLELGYGFCFIGQQHRLTLGNKEYFIDLLFYHRFLRSLIAFELKIGPFEPEYAGKMDFYLNLLNDKERGPDDNASIGIILCAEKDDLEVEFALKSKANPIGVAEYQLEPTLPRELRGKLPSGEELRQALGLPEKKRIRN